jgi:hypothetical protein
MVSKKSVGKTVVAIGINAEMLWYISVVLCAQLTCSHIMKVVLPDTSFMACLN